MIIRHQTDAVLSMEPGPASLPVLHQPPHFVTVRRELVDTEAAMSNERFLTVTDVAFAYPKPQGGPESPLVLKGVNLTVQRGEFVAILGANGSGQSTLARHLNGLLLPTGGEVRV